MGVENMIIISSPYFLRHAFIGLPPWLRAAGMRNRRDSLRAVSAEKSVGGNSYVGLLAFRIRLDVAGMLLGVAVVVDAYEQ